MEITNPAVASAVAVCAAIGALTLIAFVWLLILTLLDRARNRARRENEQQTITTAVNDVERWLATHTEDR